jgi:hypothetical protein
MNSELLPCDDAQWERGTITHSGPVFGANLVNVETGHCAQVCQAAHILGRVHRHRADHGLDPAFRLSEAMQLQRTLKALDSMLQKPAATIGSEHSDNAIAICCSARFLLYDVYACNSKYEGMPTGEEAEMQKVSLDGIEECVERMYQVALRQQRALTEDYEKGSILLIHAMYWTASECRWYIKEGKQEAVKVFEAMIDTLNLLNRRWRRAGTF